MDATTADEDHAAIDDTGDIQPLLARLLPDDAPRPQIEAVDFLRLPWREDDPSSGNNRHAPLPAGGLDPLPEGGGLMEDIERIDPLRYHLAAVGH